MFKYLRLIFLIGPKLIYSYFTWIIKYARNPQKYPLEKRYERVRSLILFLFKHLHIEYQLKGYEHLINQKEPFVLYVNHYSNFDPLLLVALSQRPLSFVAKKETTKHPFVGKFIRILESVAIDRNDLRSQVEMIDKTINLIKSGRDVAIFPEGTRNRRKDAVVSEFKPGAFKLSYRTGATVIPCALYGTTRPLSFSKSLKKYPLWVTFFEPFAKEQFLQYSTVDFAPLVQNLVNEEIDRIKVEDKKYLLALKSKKK